MARLQELADDGLRHSWEIFPQPKCWDAGHSSTGARLDHYSPPIGHVVGGGGGGSFELVQGSLGGWMQTPTQPREVYKFVDKHALCRDVNHGMVPLRRPNAVPD